MIYDKPTCQDYHAKKFDEYNFNWKLIYRVPGIATFQKKVVFSSVHVYMHIAFAQNFIFEMLIFVVKSFYVSEFNNCVLNLITIKIKIYNL